MGLAGEERERESFWDGPGAQDGGREGGRQAGELVAWLRYLGGASY